MQYAVACGNPFDGVTLYGPFETMPEAQAYAEKIDGDYWVVELNPAN